MLCILRSRYGTWFEKICRTSSRSIAHKKITFFLANFEIFSHGIALKKSHLYTCATSYQNIHIHTFVYPGRVPVAAQVPGTCTCTVFLFFLPNFPHILWYILLRIQEQLKPEPSWPQKASKLLEISRLRFLSILCCIT